MSRPTGHYGLDPEVEKQYVEKFILPCRSDPYLWMLTAYPWGQEGTRLAGSQPSAWQEELTLHLSAQLKGMKDGSIPKRPIKVSVKSGHGPGKSAMAGMLTDWALATCVDTRVLITANTDTQLKDKTMPEVRKWHDMSISSQHFTATATAIKSNEKGKGDWMATAVPWSEENPEAFSGLHNKGSRILVIMDESSAIPNIIFELIVTGATDADTEIIILAMGNPTRNSGYFYETFGLRSKQWHNITVDTRTVPTCNQIEIQELIDLEGEDSDIVRIRVTGKFPRASAEQFIPTDWISDAQARDPVSSNPEKGGFEEPLICGIDLARSGVCKNVMSWRRGRDAKSIPPDIFSDMPNTTDFVVKCAMRLKDMQPDVIVMDGDGLGGPIIDRLRDDYGFNIVEGRGNHRPPDPMRYKNMRAYMWSEMKDHIHHDLCLYKVDEKNSISHELGMIQTVHAGGSALVQLESKKQIITRREKSPDEGDALALTYHPEATEIQSSVSREYRLSVQPDKCRTDDDLQEDEMQANAPPGLLSRDQIQSLKNRHRGTLH